ncbi:hypothetical protein TcasGA2_TC015295 [Tribolium castaneum]|uniref:Peptidase S1 domain-containing protein n=1 Tax=Tribolium castaneum TaxID=7070 RepID=D2A4W2_TRICA|nr:hypothetical protein TcasGA2_TC015295 [Tribolium castaneum]
MHILSFLLCVVTTKAMVVRPQLYSSPCPDTFQYEMDQNGQLYGTIGVYSFDENIVRLNVELSVGNRVNSYNGEIQLANPKELIFDDIQQQRPIKYKVFFPRWENTPPRVTKISVNGQVVCSGLPIEMNNWVRVLTKINLEHTLTIKVSPLRSQSSPFVPSRNNPFLSEKANPFQDTKVVTKPIRNQFLDEFPAPVRTTTEKIFRSSGPSNELFGGNPFLNGKPTVPPTQPPPPGTCGVSIVANPLVINGNTVPRGAFPWLTAIFAVTTTGLEYKCSGSLVSQKHIITAAHCVQEGRKRPQPERFLFVLGKLNIKKWSLSEGEKMVEAEDIRIHPDYVPLTSDADIAVVILAEKIDFSKYIRPICLWSEPDDVDKIVGQKGKVVGWGRDEQDNLMTAEPKQADIPVVGQEECLRSSEAFRYITSERTFCAGERNQSGPWRVHSVSPVVPSLPLEKMAAFPDVLARARTKKCAPAGRKLPVFGQSAPELPNVKIWKKHRRIIVPTLNQSILNTFPQIICQQCDILLEILEKKCDKGEIDHYKFVTNFAVDVVSETIFGVPLNAQITDANYSRTFDKIMEVVFMRIFRVDYHSDFLFSWTKEYKAEQENVKLVKETTRDLIERKKEQITCQLEVEEEKKRPFLDVLVGKYLNEELSYQELEDEVSTFLLAGSDTNATAGCFVLTLLGMHQDVQEKLYEEIIEVLGPEKYPTLDDLPKLKYTERVIKETLRLFPGAPFIARIASDDIDLGDYVIPRGSNIAVGYVHLHRSEKYWEEPLKFNPERFLPENVAKRHPYTWLPFSGGLRNCVGGKFGMMVMKIMISMIIRKFRVKSSVKSVGDIELTANIVLKPKNGFRLAFTLR